MPTLRFTSVTAAGPRAVLRSAGRHNRACFALLLSVGAVAVASHASAAQVPDEPPAVEFVIPRLHGGIELDGRIVEQAWDRAARLEMVQHQPSFGAEPTERTEVLVGYDDEYIYVGCRCHDRGEPAAPSFKRDFYSNDSDYFTLVLDTFNDNENAVAFETTPTGLRADQAIAYDAEGSSPNDNDWDAPWEVEVRQTADGWFAEIRIPVKTLRFEPDANGRVVMGLIVTRYVARKNEIMVFPAIPPNWGGWSPWKPSRARDVVFHDLRPQTPLRVSPYVLAGYGQRSDLNPEGTAYAQEREPARALGADAKYGLTTNLTLDLTLNTDFAQVEADDRQVNLTRSSLFFPEKRGFFLERSSNFAFDFGERNRLFHSRRIGIQQGEQVGILGGARVVGRVGPWDLGILSIQTARGAGLGIDGGTLPSENFGVARLRRRVLNPYSSAGGIVTTRIGMDGSYSVAYGVDGVVRVAGDEYISMKWAQTFEEGAPNRVASLDPARLLFRWERRRYDGLGYNLALARAGEDYQPGIGFEARENYLNLAQRIGYGWLPGDASSVQAHRLELLGDAYFRNQDQSVESFAIGPAWEMTTNTGHSFRAGASHRVEDLRTPLALSEDVEIPLGRYTFQEGELRYGTPAGRKARGRVALSGGRFFDGTRASLQLHPTWNASRYFRLTGAYQLDRVDLPQRDQGLASHIARLRIEVTPAVEYALSGFLQYSSLGDALLANVRLRYNPREGTDLYLVLNEELNTERRAVTPSLPLSGGRTLLLKYTHAFHW